MKKIFYVGVLGLFSILLAQSSLQVPGLAGTGTRYGTWSASGKAVALTLGSANTITGVNAAGTGIENKAVTVTAAGISVFPSGGQGSTSGVQLVSASPTIRFSNTSEAGDEVEWAMGANGTSFQLKTLTSAFGVGKTIFSTSRSGTAITALDFGNASDNPAYGFLGTALTTFGGPITAIGGLRSTVLSGTGNRITTSSAVGTLGNATTIAGAYTFSDPMILSGLLTANGGVTLGTAQVFQGGATAAGHAFGATSGSTFLNIAPTSFSPSSTGQILTVGGVSNLAPGQDGRIVGIAGTLVEAASGVHGKLLGTLFAVPTITGGVATATDASTVYIAGPTTATVTGANYALWVDAGAVQLDGTLTAEGAVGMSSTLKVAGTGLFGATIALTGAFGSAELEVAKTSNGTFLLSRDDATTGAATFEFLKRRTAWGVVSSGDRLGSIGFSGADGVDAASAAQIYGEVDGTPGSNDMPGRIIFAVSPDGSATAAEAVRISQDKSTKFTGSINMTAVLISPTAPTISSGFGTSPSVSANNGTAAFRINVGTGGTASTGVIGLPTATTGWNCFCSDITTVSATVFMCKQTASTTTTASIAQYTTAAIAGAWAASDILAVSCFAY